MLQAINLNSDSPIKQTHRIAICGMCPVSGEPQEGSFVQISYTTKRLALDVLSIEAFVNSFYNSAEARDLEAVCLQIAKDVQKALEVPVKVVGSFLLKERQSLITEVISHTPHVG